jgi:hypothetical protein
MRKAPAAFRYKIAKDLFILGASVIVAIALSKSGLISNVFWVSGQSELIGAFLAGILFTSLFTTPIAIAMFISLSPVLNPVVMALVGACGAVIGDLALFGLIRYTFSRDVEHVLAQSGLKRFTATFHRRMFRWVLPFVGALIIASPLPDELGIGLIGVSRTNVRTLVSISFVMNALGIVLIGLAA